MSKEILIGPLLGFENGDVYTVCVLAAPFATPPSLNVAKLNQTIPFNKLANIGPYEFWRAEFPCSRGATPAKITYTISAKTKDLEDQHGRGDWTFYVPGNAEQPLIAYASCNGFSSAKLARDTDVPYRLWQKMVKLHKTTPCSLLLMGGDQVYADEIWESKRCPSLQVWNELSGKEQEKAIVTPAMATEIAAFYDTLYIDRWKDADMSLMFASVPSVMMWDDHDIFDGWGSYPEKRHECAVFQAVFKNASRVFDLFQLRGSARNRLNPQANHRSLILAFGEYQILALDNRSERTMMQIMSPQNWDDVKAWLAGFKGKTISKLLVMAGVPVVYRSFATVEAIMNTTPWHEELEDDVYDHWSSRTHLAERMRLIMVLLNFLEEHKKENCKGILLSGDVHVGALGQVWNERKELGLTQIISTGIVHPPPTAFGWAGIQLMTSDTPEALGDGDVVTEMLTPLGGDRYLRTRNFSTLQQGTDGKIWINWICENEKMKPSFAIS